MHIGERIKVSYLVLNRQFIEMRNEFKKIIHWIIFHWSFCLSHPSDHWEVRTNHHLEKSQNMCGSIPRYKVIVLSLIIGPLLLWGSAANFQSYIVYDPRRKWGNQVMRSDNRNMISWFGKNSFFFFQTCTTQFVNFATYLLAWNYRVVCNRTTFPPWFKIP